MDKTNAIRLLDAHHITYTTTSYDPNIVDGVSVAHAVNKDVHQVFKTLVCVGSDQKHYVFVLPVNETLNLKKAAQYLNLKWIELIKQKELFPLTGYVHGGCSEMDYGV